MSGGVDEGVLDEHDGRCCVDCGERMRWTGGRDSAAGARTLLRTLHNDL